MLLRRASTIRPSEITDERVYYSRREFMRTAAGALAAAGGALSFAPDAAAQATLPYRKLPFGPFHTREGINSYEEITTYNNFYEFGSAKSDPSRLAGRLKTRPWTIKVDGLCDKPAEYDLDDLFKNQALEERVYRLRCVEGWSMVIPWIGVPLAPLLQRFQPTSQAKFVEFLTLYRPSEMPGQRSSILHWPYLEGLRLDEAMHPLTMLAVGLYGKTLLNQNGAPVRLVVPWKYGFKSIKSIVRLRFVDKQPVTTWERAYAEAYGFYANVNPEVDHPRWSQRRERRIGEFFRRETTLFNGYGEQVAGLYEGMDLRKNY